MNRIFNSPEKNLKAISAVMFLVLIFNFLVLITSSASAQCIITSSATTICQGETANLCAPTGWNNYQWSNGATTRCISVGAAGTYTVTLSNPGRGAFVPTSIDPTTNPYTCSATIIVNPAPAVTISGSGAAICPGQSTSICGTQGFSSYKWSTGASTACINVNASGTYTLEVMNTLGCKATASRTVSENPAAISTITGNPVICSGQTSMLCAPSGNSTYLWSTGSTAQCINVSNAGNYSVTVTTSKGCTSSSSKSITQSGLPVVSISGNSTVCQGQSVSLCATAGFASYAWSNGTNSQCATLQAAGTYTVTATNSNGCTNSATKSISVTPLTNITITGSNGTLCQGQSATICAPTGYDTYTWNTGETSQCVSVSNSGTYSVTAKYNNNANGCGATGSQAISVIPAASCVITGNSSFCEGGSTQICAPSGMASYSWSNGATTECITVNTGGNFTVTYVNANGCTGTCSKAVNMKSPPVCSITGNNTMCQGGTTELCATPGMSSYVWSGNAQTDAPCINITSPGTYTVITTGVNGCSASCSEVVTLNQPQQCTVTGSDGTICTGQTTTLCAPSGFGNYSWSNGETTQCITVSTAGNYSVNLTNATSPNVCNTTCNKSITLVPLNCTITGCSGTICPGQSATICAPSGNASYLWSTGATTECITINTAGNYSVTITNSNGCTASASQAISITQAGNCSITGNSTICPGQTIPLCAPQGYSNYLWSNGATTQCITVNAAGSYSVTVSNSGSGGTECASTCSKTITLVQPQQLSLTTSTPLICEGQPTDVCAPSGYISYLWSNGATTRCISVQNAGTYSATATNELGCTSSGSQSVNLAMPPSISISGSTVFCQGQSTTLCAPSGFSSYSWSTGATTSCITVSTAGAYSVTVSGGTLGVCSLSSTANVIVNPLPSCSISGNTSICPGSSIQLCGTQGMASYSWNGGSTSQCITVNSTGTYSLTITDANGCSSTCNKPITANPPPPCTISGNSSFCQGTSTQLCASPGMASYLWSTGATTQCISVTTAGTYSVTATNFLGCTASCSKTLTITAPPPCAITGNSSFCAGGSTQLCAPAGLYAYLWSTGATTQCITVNTAGIYSVVGTSSTGCVSSCTKNITQNTATNCTITGNNSVCSGGSTQLCAVAGASSYLWSTGATTQCINATVGNYSVIITNSNGCASTCSKAITGNSAATFAISGNSAVCPGGTAQLCSPPGFVSYSWNTGATSSCITVNTPGVYTLTATDANGCVSSSSKSVTLASVPVCTITGNTSICQGNSTTLCAPAGLGSYLWSNGSLTDDPCTTVNSPGTYTVTVTSLAGCVSTCSKTVTFNNPPVVAITGNASMCQGTSTIICAPAGYTSYNWNNNSTSQCISVNQSGNYSVTVTDANGCTGIGAKQVSAYTCGITLTKTPSTCEVMQGTPTPVTFTYVVKNTGTNFSASGSLVDDNGTFSNSADDVVIANWGPLAPGASATYTKVFTVSGNYTNVAVASGLMAGNPVSAVASCTITGISCSCNLAYPDNSNLPKSAVVFNESEVLRASDPGTTACGTTGGEIKLWYNDEHALTLGVSTVYVKTASGTTTTNYNVTPTPATYGCVTNPSVGDTISSGDQSANDVAAGGGRPLWPALFITDLTVNGMSSRAGDWQQGGKGVPPSKVCGTWKSAIRTVDKTTNPVKVTITPNADPAKNNWNLGSGSTTPPNGFASLVDEGYGAQISWYVNDLGLIPGHTYRLQFMVHDGDQNKTGGDVGESCTTIRIPGNNCMSTVNLGNLVWGDQNKNGIKDATESGIADVSVKLYSDANNDNVADGAAISTTTTNATGNYSFTNLAAGNYIVGVVLNTGDSVVNINGGDPDNNIDNDNNGITISGNEIRSNAVTLNIGTEPINDGDGGNGNLSVDFAVKQAPPAVFQKCYAGTNNSLILANQTWSVNTADQTVKIRTTFSKNFVDNTYGTNAVGWSGGHTFSQLTGSDKLQLALFDANNVKKMEFAVDYLSASATVPSGFTTLGVSGGDGSMITGSATDIVSCKTSLDANFNELNYVLATNSPATNSFYTVNSTYPNWIYDVWYEVTVKLSAFPGGFGEPLITSMHASPSKTGNSTEPMSEIICAPLKFRAPEAPTTRNINAYVYPNPSKSITHFTFERTGARARTVVEIYSLTGNKIVTVFDDEIDPDILYKVDFNTESLASGTYTYKVVSEEKVLSGKLIIIKE